ncbi:hypothetical protein [Methylocystis rosea]|uniref:Uncharacterized protein n=1 Tax=Methylocystis rosea TaxID=173366 RepID=A0A3G8M7Q4_9HYPH|nr:hypothetical protein [Methylocystis rosea]AZG77325.1 hypothetical protein EHO51_11595 [Methylocystis rosea]
MSISRAYSKTPATNTIDPRVEIIIFMFYHSDPTPSASRLSLISTQKETGSFCSPGAMVWAMSGSDQSESELAQ